ncbi:hypothetical protein [Streptomyces sp. CB02488]|uniref:hypothetical protein n=1 Tax=Streptomyces sp. CB02488 TaxID=1703920 RepID=UPI000AA34652|nr:hypothetical protein [Streptomyces sp. CB02488]
MCSRPRSNADGSSTLTLPDGDRLDLAANGTKTGTRYYTHNGETVAVRTGGTISYLISDHQGTAMSAIAVGTLAITRRKQLPFGQLRSQQSTALEPAALSAEPTTPQASPTSAPANTIPATAGGPVRLDPFVQAPACMKFTLKMLANLTDPTGGDAMDRIINGLSKVAPKA